MSGTGPATPTRSQSRLALVATHDHGHDHALGHRHAHAVSRDADRRALTVAFLLIAGFMVCEVVVGLAAHSLVLLADAAHMLTDAGALGLGLLTIALASRPARGSATFGLRRSEILSAQFNGASLLVLALLIVYQGVTRLISPPDVGGRPILYVALAGIAVNVVAAWVLARANRESLNVEGSFQHILTDLFAFIGTAVAGGVIIATGFTRADPIASLIVAALMLRAAYRLLRDSGRVFLEMAPKGLDPDEIGQALADYEGVVNVHDLHVWEITSGMPSLSAHVVVRGGTDCHAAREALSAMLAERFGLTHTTLQVDHSAGNRLYQVASKRISGET
jgi:cobalt-zinc-cadmium efflux system protein